MAIEAGKQNFIGICRIDATNGLHIGKQEITLIANE
jgi:hypothetical protein